MWRRAAADVADLSRQRVGQLALDEDVPLLRELRPNVGREDAVERARATARRSASRRRIRLAADPGAGRRVEGPLPLEVERRVRRQAQVLAGAFHVLHDAEAAADDPLVRRRPGDAEPRLEPAVVRVVERAAVAVLAGEQQLPGRAGRCSTADRPSRPAVTCIPTRARGSA